MRILPFKNVMDYTLWQIYNRKKGWAKYKICINIISIIRPDLDGE